MEILKLRLKGFIGIQKGLDLDEIEIYFSDLSGLVAFDGPNGHGKTTILDNLHPYRCLASRSKSLQHHVFLRDSEKEFTFKFENDTYRTLIKIDSESERTEGFIYKNGSTESETTGKVKEYDRYITDLFGTQSLFFNSIFCAQNADKLSDMTTGALKALFSEFLKLDELVKYEETSKQCVNILTGQKEGIETKIDVLKPDIENLEISAAGLDRNKGELELCEKGIETRKEKIKACEKQLNVFKEASLEEGVLLQRISDQQKIIDEINSEMSNDSCLTEKTLGEKRVDLIKIRTGIADAEKILLDKENIIRSNETAISKKHVLEVLRSDLASKQLKKEGASKTISNLKNDYTEKTNELSSASNDQLLKELENELAVCNDSITDLDKKDPECKSKTCSFIVRAVEAKERLPRLKELIHTRRNELTPIKLSLDLEVDDLRKEIEKQESGYSEIEKEWFIINEDITSTSNIINDAEQKSILLPQVKVAEEKISNLKDRESELTQDGLKFKDAHKARNKISEEKLTASETIIAGLKSGIDSSLLEQSTKIENEIKELEGLIQIAEPETRRLSAEIATAEKDKTTIDIKKEQLSGFAAELIAINKELSDWQYLKNACSKDGLRALEIDSVSPIITGYANDLLNSTFGPDYTIKFRTQDEETGKEVLDILAIRDDGTEVNLDNLSGGEKVWSLKALRQAMTLLSKEKSGKNFLTALADEEDGALNMENAVNFVKMYRTFMTTGGFSACFFITHRKECVALADHVLKFAKGAITQER